MRQNAAKLDVSVGLEIVRRQPSIRLSEVAEGLNADRTVVGPIHHVAGDIAKLRSNAYAIIAHAPCPVLSV